MSKLRFVVPCLLVSLCALPLLAEVKVAPYYSLQVAEGASIPSKGDWMFALNLESDLGVILQTNEKNRFIGFYELKYDGPGLRREEGEKFTDRNMNHIVVFRHHYALSPAYLLKTQVDYMTEYKRTGTNEVWGKGLYDFNRYGGGLTLERRFNPDITGSVSAQYHYLAFPNYTDLLREFQAGGEAVESSTGKQNHTLYQTGAAASYKNSRVSLDYVIMAYDKQQVIVETVQPDRTYYSSTLQKDTVFSINFQHDQKLFSRMMLSPSLTLKTKTSNQNYQHFTTATSSIPVTYIGNYYDYSQVNVALPFSTGLSSKWSFYFTPEWDLRMYASRPPRDTENNFVDGTQANTYVIVNLGFSFKPNDITRTTLFYTSQTETSNMKFEKYLPYNYSASYFGIAFNYSY